MDSPAISPRTNFATPRSQENVTAKTPLLIKTTAEKARAYHARIPGLRMLPAEVVWIITGVVVLNALVWAAVAVVLHFNPTLIAPAVLSYTLGLRHALDADHITAIDLTTRRLIAANQRPVAVGFFFSLGHSTIVIITSIAVAATSAALSSRFDDFGRVGGIIGTSVSAVFILLLAAVNAWVLYLLVVRMRARIRKERGEVGGQDAHDEVDGENEGLGGGGVKVRVLGRALKLVNRSWKMYPLGVLLTCAAPVGLGFDTSSEVALLGIASLQATQGTSIWLILIFPILFTVGMCLLDTIDGALMSTLYQSSRFTSDPIAVLYYSIVLTLVTVVVACFIGTVQVLMLAYNLLGEPDSAFWRGVERLGDWYDVVGASVVGLFVVVAVVSVLVFKRWRRWVVGKSMGDRICGDEESGEEGPQLR
ncbi:NicO-domain-containing protein [Ascodesmis nigricans]|uniref:Nickel/cobalt efflux system n=1 Tax=Ascodesmis nigricans TaxID=341454 RepID=A0A4S2MLI1_9PEZI|nr:NicO-domain-containing protein [Ascodesmis nigricans]